MHKVFSIFKVWLLLYAVQLHAKPLAPDLFCKAFPDIPACAGSALKCSFCHIPASSSTNAFGSCLQAHLKAKQLPYPSTRETMAEAITAIGDQDCDHDGFPNKQELLAGSLPADANSLPYADRCTETRSQASASAPRWNHCTADLAYVYQKVWKDFCGEPPEFDEYQDFKKLSPDKKKSALTKQLDDCLASNNWRGKDGVIWEIGHYKIRPVGSVKAGEDPGLIPIVDYYADFNLFVYTQIDGHDARDMLLAPYTVSRTGGGSQPTTYTMQSPDRLRDGQLMQPQYRVGLLSTFWNLGFYLNFTGIARVLVAQAFNAYLGFTLSDMQGLNPPDVSLSKFKDYDAKGVARSECAVCHETIDPLAYPFRNYNGLTGTTPNQVFGKGTLADPSNLGDENNLIPLSYSRARLTALDQSYPGIIEMPETGFIFGQRVESLNEWAQVLVNSDAFAANLVRDYWKVLIGHEPKTPGEHQEFTKLWKDFKTVHQYSVDAMLHDLVNTEAYRVP